MSPLDAAFALGLGALAVLGRQGHRFVYPQILWLLALFLAATLAARRLAARTDPRPGPVAALVAAGALIVTGIVRYSGGAGSELWVLYLVPLFSGCLVLPRRLGVPAIALITLCPLGFHIAERKGPPLEAALKSFVLIGSGAAILRAGRREQASRLRAESMREKLERAAKALASSARTANLDRVATVGEMAGGIVHDLNGPLNVILGSVELALSNNGRDPALLRKDLERIGSAARHCSNLTHGLLRWIRKEDNPLVAASPEALIRESVGLCAYQLEQAGQKAVLDLEPGLPEVLANPVQVERVLVNLLLNACQQSPAGAEVRIEARALPGKIEIAILDQGTGLSPEVERRLFQPFFTTKPDGQGTGLGLAVSRTIVERHGGELAAANRPGGGARFAFTLRRRDA